MTEKQFYRILKRSGQHVIPRMINDPTDMRFQVGLMMAILDYHIPPYAYIDGSNYDWQKLYKPEFITGDGSILVAIWKNRDS